MVGELYKMFHKKYCIALMFLLLIPILFGLGYFFNLSYIIDNEENMSSMLGYCFEMQVDIKYLYFFVVIFLACDMFSAEIEEGQIRTLLVYTASRKKVFLQKYGALCASKWKYVNIRLVWVLVKRMIEIFNLKLNFAHNCDILTA